MGEIARNYLPCHRNGELIVIREFSFLENSHVNLQRFKREVHFELHKISFKGSLTFSLQMLAAPRFELLEAWLVHYKPA